MDHGCHHRCTSTRDGQDVLRVLSTEATMQEMAIPDMLATSRTGGLQDKKNRIVQNAKPNHLVPLKTAAALDRRYK
jgi:hypothetical protein